MTPSGGVKALNGVSYAFEQGVFYAIIGRSGSGKSTLLHALGGLEAPTRGQVLFHDQDLYALSDSQMAVFRRQHMGFVFQQFNLLDEYNVKTNICMPLKLDHKKPDPVFFQEIVDTLGLGDQLKKFPSKVAAGFEALLSQPRKGEGSVSMTQVTTGLRVEGLSFSYPDRAVLRDVSYWFQPGEKYVILGESGCGKSTLLKLLTGLEEPQGGAVLQDQVEIGTIKGDCYPKLVTCLPQEPFLFDGSIAMNVSLGRGGSEEEILQALHRAGLGEYLRRLPEGIHTNVGENAAQMSGGEKQRLSIARTLLFPAPILLMDESTSHLDPATAAEIESLIFGLKDTTVIFVTHNLTQETRAKA